MQSKQFQWLDMVIWFAILKKKIKNPQLHTLALPKKPQTKKPTKHPTPTPDQLKLLWITCKFTGSQLLKSNSVFCLIRKAVDSVQILQEDTAPIFQYQILFSINIA